MLTFNKTGADDLLTSKEAAAISGYSSDYVDQLCRESKVECRMIRDSWYIRKQSLIDHKNLVEKRVAKSMEGPGRARIVSDAGSSVSTKSVKISKSGNLIKMLRVPTVRRDFTGRRLNRLHSAIQQGSAKATKILSNHVTGVPSKDFWHKALSIITAIVLVFGSYHLTQSGLLLEATRKIPSVSADLATVVISFARKGPTEIVSATVRVPQVTANVLDQTIRSVKGSIEVGGRTVSIAAEELGSDPFGYVLRTGYVLYSYLVDTYQVAKYVSLSLFDSIKYTAMVGKINLK